MSVDARPFPVLVERSLARAPRKFLFRSRQLAELPASEPGAVFVFERGSAYVALTDRQHLAGNEDLVVNAVSVSLVSMRACQIPVSFRLPSSSAADDFTVVVDFTCQVVDPEKVAEHGWTDLRSPLRTHLKQNGTLAGVSGVYPVGQITKVRQEVSALVEAYCRLRPPALPGIRAELAGVSVQTPTALADHERDLRDQGWRHKLDEREQAAEDRTAARLNEYFERGPEALSSIAAAKNQLNLAEAAERAHTERAQKEQNLIKLLEVLPDGALDTIAVDAERLFASVIDSAMPHGRARGDLASAEPAAQLDEGQGSRETSGD
jgi:hypothetical protein